MVAHTILILFFVVVALSNALGQNKLAKEFTIVGNTSKIYFSQPLCGLPPDVKTSFYIYTGSDTVQSLKLYSQGLGNIIFKVGGLPPSSSLQLRPKRGQMKVEITIPVEKSFCDNGLELEGSILAMSTKDTTLLPLKITKAESDFKKAFSWFLGIFVPTILTAIVGGAVFYWQQRSSKKKNEQEIFQSFKKDKYNDLNAFFVNVLNATPANSLREELDKYDIISKLPQKDYEEILIALDKNSIPKVKNVLINKYSEWSKNITSYEQV